MSGNHWGGMASTHGELRQIALHFVQDKNTRFDLAIECGNLDVALETAQSIDRPECWERLAQQALKQGNHKVGDRRSHLPDYYTDIVARIVRSSRRPTSGPRTLTASPSCTWLLAALKSLARWRRSQTRAVTPCLASTMHFMPAMSSAASLF